MTPNINHLKKKEHELIEFNATLRPNNSLSPIAFLIFMSLFGLISFIAGIIFIIVGAWPVFGFLGLDVFLMYLALKRNFKDSLKTERLWITKNTLHIEKVFKNKRVQKFEFQTYWLRVELHERPGRHRSLTLTSHGKSIEIGKFLSPEEKLQFSNLLRTELHRVRINGT